MSGQPTATRGLRAGPVRRGHEHLWVSPDGTGLHCPPGELVRDRQSGQLCCHLCGRWFVSLGSHVRVHGYTAAGYRRAMGLCAGQGLVAQNLAASIADRQRRAYVEQPAVRDRFAAGQDLARTGRLAWRAKAAASASAASASAAEPAQRLRARSASLAAGRASQQVAREQQLRKRLAGLGHAELDGYLRATYGAGGSLALLAAETGLGRASLRSALLAAGVQVRPSGSNTADGRRCRARAADAAAAQHLGVADIRGWLTGRYRDGWSLQKLAAAVGHSSHWVRWRLDDELRGPAPAPAAGSGAGAGAGAGAA